jgi:hypothetical protein
MGDGLMMFINAIDGAIRAIKAHTDHAGAVFMMSLLAEPQVSYTDIVHHARECASLKWLDIEWMKLLEFRIHIIVSTMRLLGENNFRRMANVDWWAMGRDDLAAEHKEILLQEYLEREEEALIKARQALEDH